MDKKALEQKFESLRNRLTNKASSLKDDDPNKKFYQSLASVVEDMRVDLAHGYDLDAKHVEALLEPIEATL